MNTEKTSNSTNTKKRTRLFLQTAYFSIMYLIIVVLIWMSLEKEWEGGLETSTALLLALAIIITPLMHLFARRFSTSDFRETVKSQTTQE